MRTLILACLLSALHLYTHAQCDNTYYSLKEGTAFELTTFNKKDKAEARSENTIAAVEDTSEGKRATVHTKLFDDKDKMIYEGDYYMLCDDGKVKIDMKSMFENMMGSMQQNSGSPDMDMSADGLFMIIPSNLSVGDKLPDTEGNFTVKMGDSDMAVSSTDIHMNNREVIAQERITTPAGTFDCLKIKQDIETAIKVMMINRKESAKGELWIAEGVGVVRFNDYDRKGKLRSYTLLTKYE